MEQIPTARHSYRMNECGRTKLLMKEADTMVDMTRKWLASCLHRMILANLSCSLVGIVHLYYSYLMS